MWPPLKKLNLASNALRYLPMLLVGRWDKLKELRLMNNQWSCDCGNQYLVSFDNRGTREPSKGREKNGQRGLSAVPRSSRSDCVYSELVSRRSGPCCRNTARY